MGVHIPVTVHQPLHQRRTLLHRPGAVLRRNPAPAVLCMRDRAPKHGVDDVDGSEPAYLGGHDVFAIAEHGDAVGDPEKLVEAMADIED